MKTLNNILETYNWLNEAFVHQTEEETEQDLKFGFKSWPFILKKFGMEAILEILNVVFSLEKDRKDSYCQFLDALNGFLEDAYQNHPDIWEEFGTYDIRGCNCLCSFGEWINDESTIEGEGWGAFNFTDIWRNKEVIEEIGKPHFLDGDVGPDFEFYWNDPKENYADTTDCGIHLITDLEGVRAKVHNNTQFGWDYYGI